MHKRSTAAIGEQGSDLLLPEAEDGAEPGQR
jgi:hypothetical protein